MGLRENLSMGENAVFEVKKWVQHGSNNLRGDLVGAKMQEFDVRKPQLLQQKKEIENSSMIGYGASVSNKAAFFKQTFAPTKLPPTQPRGAKVDVFLEANQSPMQLTGSGSPIHTLLPTPPGQLGRQLPTIPTTIC